MVAFGQSLEMEIFSSLHDTMIQHCLYDKQAPTFLTEDFKGTNPDSIFTSTITMLEPLRSPV